jgi:hypothetical protein
VVVRWPCCGAYLGRVFTVGLRQRVSHATCSACDAYIGWQSWVQDGTSKRGFAVECLKRIPPLEELDEVRTEDEVTA